jgi:hypothetical protein
MPAKLPMHWLRNSPDCAAATRIVSDLQTSLQGAQEVSRLLQPILLSAMCGHRKSQVLAASRGD